MHDFEFFILFFHVHSFGSIRFRSVYYMGAKTTKTDEITARQPYVQMG